MTKIAPIAGSPAASITRTQAFDLLHGGRHAPRNAAILRSEPGAAWDYALDAGRVPEDAPNGWHQVMRGKLKSAGRKRGGKVENVKRVLSEDDLRSHGFRSIADIDAMLTRGLLWQCVEAARCRVPLRLGKAPQHMMTHVIREWRNTRWISCKTRRNASRDYVAL